MIIPEIPFQIRESWSCGLCQSTTYTPQWMDKKPFCNYKHAFRFVWRLIFGWTEKASLPQFGSYEATLSPGWTDSQIEEYARGCHPQIFSKLKYSRQNWAFQLCKIKMGGLKQ